MFAAGHLAAATSLASRDRARAAAHSRCLAHAVILTLLCGFVTVTSTFLFATIVPGDGQQVWTDVPVLGIVSASARPGGWAPSSPWQLRRGDTFHPWSGRAPASLARAHACAARTAGTRDAHPYAAARFGTLARAIDTAALIAVIAIVISSGRVEWLGASHTRLVRHGRWCSKVTGSSSA